MSNQIIAEASIDVNEAPRQVEQAQNTANNAFSGVKTINDPNQLGPAEKATLKRKYDQDLLLYSMDKKKLNDAQLSTTEIDNAMSALSAYMTPLFSNMKTVDTIDRDTLNQLFSDFDTADKNSDGAFTNMVSNAASEATVAGNQASEAASNASVQAIVAVSNANVAQSSVVAAIAKAGFASDTASAASQAATSAALTANTAAAGVIDAKNDAANALTSAATAFNVANGAKDSAASTLDKVKNLQNGGRNYILNSNVNWTELFQHDIYLSQPLSFFVGKTITLSAQVDFDNAVVTGQSVHRIGFEMDTTNNSIKNWLTVIDGDSYHGRIIITMPFSLETSNQTNVWVTGGVQGFTADSASVRDIQLEIGNLASDYSQAPEDVQVQISDINGQLQSKVSQESYNQLTDTVTQTSTLAQQNKDALLTKASTETVNTVKKTVDSQATSIEETSQKIALKADKQAVDTISNSVDSQAAELKIASDSINGLTTSTKTLGDQYTNLSGQLELNSNKLESSFSKVQGALDNVGQVNFVYNSGYKNQAEGWDMRGKGYLTTVPTSMYQESPGLAINVSGQNPSSAIAFGFSKVMPLPGNMSGNPQTMSFGVWIKLSSEHVEANMSIEASIAFMAANGTTRVSFAPTYGTATDNQWHYCKVENVSIPEAAVGVRVEYYSHATTMHAFVAHPMLVINSSVGPYVESTGDLATSAALTKVSQTAEQASLTASDNKNNITNLSATAKDLQLSLQSKADSSDLNNVKSAVQQNTATIDANSKSLTSTISKVQNNLSNVGAPNLVSATGWTTGADGSGSLSTIVTHAFYKGTQPLYTIYNKSTLENYAYSQRFDLKPNTTYVVRFIGFEDVHVSSMDLFVLARKSGETVDHTQVYNPVKGIVLSSSGTQEVKNYTFTTGADVNSGYIRIDNNGSKDGSTGGLYFTEVQLEEGSVSTPYRRSEADQATVTALTQVKQTAEGAQALATNNQGDITNLQATAKGIQTTVSNNYSDLKSQVTQTDSAWRVALSNTGQTNLVYNSNFNDNAEGWTTNSQGYLTEDPAGTYQGSPGWAINKTNTGWIEFGRSKLYKLPVTDVRADNTYSAVALVKPYGDFTDGNALGTTLAYFDANQNRVSGWHDMMVVSSASTRNVWTLVKCEDYKVPANAVYIGLQFQAHNISGTVHGVINHPMITSGPTIGPYTESTSDLATQSDITQSISNIHLGFKNSNGSTFQMNLSADGVALMDFSKIMLNGATNIANGTIGTAQIADAAITNAKITNLDASKITTGTLDASHIDSDQLIATLIDGKTINAVTLNTPSLNMGDNGQITGTYSVNDDTGWFQPINGTGKLNIDHGYIQSTANILYYNKLMNGMGDKWGHWESSTTFVPAPDQAHPDVNNVAESTLTPAFLKLDIFNADKSLVNSRAYLDGTGLYINDGGTQAISSMLSDWELLSNGMAYLMGGVQMKKESSFTFGNLAMNGYHTIAMLDGKALYFQDKPGSGGNTIELVAKTFTKSSQLSLKHDITSLSTAEASRLLNAIDVEKYRYIHDGATRAYQYGGIIDNQNELGKKKYSLPAEFLNEDGTGINLDSLTGVLIKKVQDQDKMIGELSMRLTKLEMTA